jgi:ABC-2 type transport system ATP-binding protein
VIAVEDVIVRFGDVIALDGLSVEIPTGSFFGLLGPNGAGKSTALACIAGSCRPQSGRARVDGVDVIDEPRRVRAMLGLVPQSLALFPDLSVSETLRTFAAVFGVPRERRRERVKWGLELAQLSHRRTARVGELSGGMARRLNLACALLHDPPVIICDEPTTGVDPQSRNHIFETLRALHAEGRTVVYTTHYMEEVEALCERVAIVDHGRVIANDTLDGLLQAPPGNDRFSVELDGARDEGVLRDALTAAGIGVRAVDQPRRGLEDLFLELTGRRLRDGGDEETGPNGGSA